MKPSHIKYYVVDAFTRHRFKGNPAAVVLTERPLNDKLMQQIAAEMNLSETAFAVATGPKADAVGYRLRWFTPTTEVDLCGHATLATAAVLYTEGQVPHGTPILFETKSGEMKITKRQDHICMDFPAQLFAPIDELVPALSDLQKSAIYIGRNEWLTVAELPSESQVRDYKPDFAAIMGQGSCLAITASSDTPDRDFVSRMFGPTVGIPEDPVTGSAHCGLGPYWCEKLDKSEVRGEQISQRSGIVHIEWAKGNKRVLLAGQFVIVSKGFFIDTVGHGST